MTEKPNCSNCPPFLNGDWCKLIINNDKDLKSRKRDPNGIELMEYTKLCGCLYHPGAREYLMAPVIKELGSKRTKAQKEITHLFLEQDAYREGIVKTCGDAISLIKNGVDGK